MQLERFYKNTITDHNYRINFKIHIDKKQFYSSHEIIKSMDALKTKDPTVASLLANQVRISRCYVENPALERVSLTTVNKSLK